MDGFISKLWSLLIGVVLLFVFGAVLIEAIKPYLPVIGFVLTLVIIYYIYRFFIRRRGL